MNAKEAAEKFAEIARYYPDAEVLVDGWPAVIEVLPAYYDGPSKRWDEKTKTLTFIRSGTKVQLSSLGMLYFSDMYPQFTMDTRELDEHDVMWYTDKRKECEKASKALADEMAELQRSKETHAND